MGLGVYNKIMVNGKLPSSMFQQLHEGDVVDVVVPKIVDGKYTFTPWSSVYHEEMFSGIPI